MLRIPLYLKTMTVLLCLVLISIFIGNVLPQAVTLQQRGNPERTLLSTVLENEVNLLRYYDGMSDGMSMDEGHGMGNGKGKGKGKCSGPPKSCDISSKKGLPDDKKGMGKGMGMGMGMGMSEKDMGKGMKQGMSMDKDKSIVPSLCKCRWNQYIFPCKACLITLKFGFKAPPPSVTVIPSVVNQPSVPSPVNQSSAPVSIQDIIQLLSPYIIFYQIEQTRIPSISEYAELSTFTAVYLNEYFTSVFTGTTTVFLSSITNITGSEFRLGQPVRVDYNTTLVFGFQSQMIPNMTELDARLASAFEGVNGEAFGAAVAAGVDPSNIFSTTSTISFQEASVAASVEGSKIAMIAVISIMSVMAFVGGAVAVAYTTQSEKFEKVSVQTDDPSTDSESRFDTKKETKNPIFLPKCRRYDSILQTDTGTMESESNGMRVASSCSEIRIPKSRGETNDTN